MKIKKFLSCLLSAVIAFACLPFQFVCAEETEEQIKIWDGTADITWWDDGESVFHISTPEQLAGLRDLVNKHGRSTANKTFILDNDIYLNDISDYEIWDTSHPQNSFGCIGYFEGNFYGMNHTIYGLFNNDITSLCFIKMTKNASIEQINFSSVYLFGNSDVEYNIGILNSVDSSSKIKQITVQGKIAIKGGEFNKRFAIFAGGVIAEVYESESGKEGIIDNCRNMMDICIENDILLKNGSNTSEQSASFYIGGIVGHFETGKKKMKIMHCTNSATIILPKTVRKWKEARYDFSASFYVGGIIGRYMSSPVMTVDSCGNTGKVIQENTVKDDPFDKTYKTYSDSDINNICVGGICGAMYSVGSYTVDPTLYYRVICAEISNCYNIGDIKGNGIVGLVKIESGKDDNYSSINLSNVYNAGNCSAYAIYQSACQKDECINAYYLTTSATNATNRSPDPVKAKTEANMKTESFAEALGDAFVYVEEDYPKLAWEVGNETICSRGDVNLDGSVDIEDARLLQMALKTEYKKLDSENGYQADLDLNGKVNIIDLSLLKRMLINKLS